MGCQQSSEKEEGNKAGGSEGVFDHAGIDPSHVPLGNKLNPRERIVLQCGGVFVTSARDAEVDLLVFYPDPRVIDRPPTTDINPELLARQGLPNWQSVRVQMKEFDSPDDFYKDWFEKPDRIPGLLQVEAAGPHGAWVTVNPHTYQFRYVLGNGRRMWSPIADEGVRHFSVPNRIFALYDKESDEEQKAAVIKNYLQRVERILPTVQKKMREANIQSPVLDLTFTADDEFVQLLLAEIHDFKNYNTVYEIKTPRLREVLTPILSELEDNILYNWFQVDVSANMQIGHYRFRKSAEKETHLKKTLWDRALAIAVGGADIAADGLILATHEGISLKTTDVVKKWITTGESPENGDDDALSAADALQLMFPDLEELISASTESISSEASGLTNDDLPSNPDNILELLEQWRQADSRSLYDRRKECYDAAVAEVAPFMQELREANVVNNISKEAQKALDQFARVPRMVTRHYEPFTFFCLFPKYDEDRASEMKKPQAAQLVLWPEGTSWSADAQRLPMNDLFIDPDRVRHPPPVAEQLTKKLFEGDGDDSINSDDEDDPRNAWVEYPHTQFRGFEVTVPVAMDCTYNFHFLLDDVLFIDYNSWKVDPEKGDCRRVRFGRHCTPMKLNPLMEMGLVI